MIAGTGSDIYSAIQGAIGALRGPKPSQSDAESAKIFHYGCCCGCNYSPFKILARSGPAPRLRSTIGIYCCSTAIADMSTIQIESLGYVGVNATDLDGWRHFGGELLGMQIEERDTSLALRLDDRCQRILVDLSASNGGAYMGSSFQMEMHLTLLVWHCSDAA